jgi:hypothetical protein
VGTLVSSIYSPLCTKVEGLNEQQKELLERAIDKFIINNKMCPKEYLNPSKQQEKSINQDLRRKKDDHQKNVHHQIRKKNSTKEPEVIDEKGFTLVTKKRAARGIPTIPQQLQANQVAPSDEDEDEDEDRNEDNKEEDEENNRKVKR